MTYGSRGLVGGRERLRECRRPDRRHCREACSADSPVMTADGPQTLRGQSGQLGFWEADGPPMYCGRSAIHISAGPGQLGQTNWWRRSIAWPRLLVSFRIVLKPYILHCAMTCKD